MDFYTMSARCLLAYHHPYGLMAICKKYPIITRMTITHYEQIISNSNLKTILLMTFFFLFLFYNI